MVRMFGALLLAGAAGAWGLAFFGQCPVKLCVALSLMCSGLAWSLVPLWASRETVPDADTLAVNPDAHAKARKNAALLTDAKDHAQRFSRTMLSPADVDTPVVKLHSAYLDWCRALGEEPCGTREIGTELAALFRRTGVEIVDVEGTRCVSRARVLPLGRSVALGTSMMS